MSSDIVIEITGLKSLSKFIGLEDTPLYYDNGKFFKVEDNKIIYTDIEWKDISGNIEEAPEIVDLIEDFVKTISGETIQGYIEEHNNSESAHPYIQNTIQEEIFTRIEADNTLQDNIDITNNNLEKEVEDRTDGDTLLQNNINNLSNTVTNNYNTLNNKIDTEILNRTSADEELQGDIDNLGNTVTNNYTELNNKILNNTNNITANTNSITNINSKIPQQASASNKLADKNFVNSSIATNTANFIGTFNSVAELEAYSGTLTNNDYAFVATTDSVGNTLYDRYKWNGSEWLFEYELNNSSFTANQWASINSGITNTLTAQITTNQNSITNIQNNYVPNIRTINGKALNTNITLNASDVNALANTTTINDLTTTAQQNALNSGATSAKISQIATNTGNITTNANAISTINGKIPADASSSNKLVTASALSNAVVNLANKDLSNLTATGNNRLHALKSYSDNGELLTDAEGLAYVKRYAHSTFDLSKFRVVGSPTITDGIASGFSSSNYIDTGYTTPSTCYSYRESIEFTTGNDVTTPQIIIGSAENTNYTASYRTFNISLDKGKWLIRVTTNGTEWNIAYFNGTITANTKYKLDFEWNGSVYSVTVTPDGGTATVIYTVNNANFVIPNRHFIGNSIWQSSNRPFLGSIDLKQFSITVDGVPVFSGNKTGIDTIKPDDYTVVGTPTISADGVLSGDRHDRINNYINYTESINLGTDFELHLPFKPSQKGKLSQCFRGMTNNAFVFLMEQSSAGNVIFNTTDGTNSLNSPIIVPNSAYETGDDLVIVFKFKNKTAEWGYIKDEVYIKTGEKTAYPLDLSSRPVNNLWFGRGANNSLIGEIDLNKIKIYVKGNLVYQPCLKIPYTQSKTGSKIVNAIYRGRVNDMAEQFGYANYYTLDEDNENFTLPQVELYGLIGDKTLRDSYYNGVTYWELFSNRRLEQGGTCESGVEYTLPKPFADANYVLTIPYSSKTATSFIPSATGDFIAKGMGLL